MPKISDAERIRRAFSCRLPLATLSEDDYRDLKYELASLRSEDVIKWLPLLLIHEIETPESGSGDSLVYLLDGNLSGRRSQTADVQRKDARALLETFTVEQVEAVRLWLKRVAKRKYGRLCQGDIDSALAYWTERESQLRSGT